VPVTFRSNSGGLWCLTVQDSINSPMAPMGVKLKERGHRCRLLEAQVD